MLLTVILFPKLRRKLLNMSIPKQGLVKFSKQDIVENLLPTIFTKHSYSIAIGIGLK